MAPDDRKLPPYRVPLIPTDGLLTDLAADLRAFKAAPGDLVATDPGSALNLLRNVRDVRQMLEEAEEMLMRVAVEEGPHKASWLGLGQALGVHRQSARDKYYRTVNANRLNASDTELNRTKQEDQLPWTDLPEEDR